MQIYTLTIKYTLTINFVCRPVTKPTTTKRVKKNHFTHSALFSIFPENASMVAFNRKIVLTIYRIDQKIKSPIRQSPDDMVYNHSFILVNAAIYEKNVSHNDLAIMIYSLFENEQEIECLSYNLISFTKKDHRSHPKGRCLAKLAPTRLEFLIFTHNKNL